jgi:hypothetical protein
MEDIVYIGAKPKKGYAGHAESLPLVIIWSLLVLLSTPYASVSTLTDAHGTRLYALLKQNI